MANQNNHDKLDAQRYRKYRAMVIAGMVEPVTTEEFDATMDSAVVSVDLLHRPDLWGGQPVDQPNH